MHQPKTSSALRLARLRAKTRGMGATHWLRILRHQSQMPHLGPQALHQLENGYALIPESIWAVVQSLEE